MTVRTTFESSVKTAAAVKLASDFATEQVRQSTIDLSNSVVGYSTSSGNYAALAAAVVAAQKAALVSGLSAEATKQIALANARDVLRTAGDVGPT
jgi:hypothetical protein